MGMHRDHGIEGLRGLAALAVMVAHIATLLIVLPDFGGAAITGPLAALLTHGVTLFFVLSGYLLYRPFVAHLMDGARSPSVRSFYRNRLLRIFPAYLVIFAVGAWVLGSVDVVAMDPDHPVPFVERTGYLTDPLTILANLTLTQGYSVHTVGTGITPAWSLVPELAFYAVLPLLWMLGRRVGRPGSVASALVPPLLFIAVGLVGFEVARQLVMAEGFEHSEGLLSGPTWANVLAHSLLANCQLFGFGMVVAVVATWLRGRASTTAVRRARLVAVGLFVFFGLAFPVARLLRADPVDMGIACSGLVLLTIAPGGGRLHGLWVRLLDSRVLHHAGVISYSVYLWHYPVTLFLARVWPDLRYTTWAGLGLGIVVAGGISIALAEVTYRYVERPALARKKSMVDPEQAGKAEAPEPAVSGLGSAGVPQPAAD